jgi:hypothetical protein
MLWLLLIVFAVCYWLYRQSDEISHGEFIISVAVCSTLVLGTYVAWGNIKADNDVMFQSGKMTVTTHYPPFVEQYEEAHESCSSDSEGNTSCTTYYTTEYAHHPEEWVKEDNLGQLWHISSREYKEIRDNFKSPRRAAPQRRCSHGGHVYRGDPNKYFYENDNNSYKYPTNKLVGWFNPLKNSTTIFNNKINLDILYPITINGLSSDRNRDPEVRINWERLNTKAYEMKGVNLIAVAVKKSNTCSDLEDHWLGGKNNDLVICRAEEDDSVKVFGWSSSALVKRSLETVVMDYGYDELKILGALSSYQPYDFTKFDYIKRPVSFATGALAAILTLIVGFLLFATFEANSWRK